MELDTNFTLREKTVLLNALQVLRQHWAIKCCGFYSKAIFFSVVESRGKCLNKTQLEMFAQVAKFAESGTNFQEFYKSCELYKQTRLNDPTAF